MTIGLLKEICREHNIPDDAVIKSDSGWECGETDTNGVYYSESENQIVLTQCGEEYEI